MGFREKFDELLSGIIIEGSLSPEQTKNKYIPLVDFAFKNMPTHLYRYRKCNESNIGGFESDSIWTVPPTMFNDVHDSLSYYDTNQILSDLREDLFGADNQGEIWEYITKHNDLPENSGKFTAENKKTILDEIISMSKEDWINKSANQQFTDTDRLKASYEMKEIKAFFRNQAKISCFCEDKYSNLMWAHYADYHEGFLLEYDKQSIIDFIKNNHSIKLFPVIYNNKRYNISNHIKWYLQSNICSNAGANIDIHIPDILYPEKTHLHKAKDWEYEKEWRIIHHATEIENVHEFKNIEPTAIYYGSRISKINKNQLSLSAKKKNIKEYDVYIDENSNYYNLESKIASFDDI